MRHGAPPGGRALMYMSALAGVVAMVGMWNFLTRPQEETQPLQHVVAVGRFETRGDSGAGPGAELQADLLQRLSHYPALQLLDLAQEGASPQGKTDFILDGSLQEDPPGWQLAVRLSDLDEDRVLWSDAFPVAPQNLEAASDRVVEGLARSLKIHPR
jgi:hypothetical protein